MKIYTRTGDDGTTGLLGPGRVPKDDARVEAYGTLDELNAALGVARTLDASAWLDRELLDIQSTLFTIGAELATTADRAVAPGVEDRHIDTLEAWIDRLEAEVPPLAQFILPGGTPLAAQLHVCRTICRRAERRVVSLLSSTSVDARSLRYLNRLADLLFVMARWTHHRAGGADIPWRPAAPP